jgi:hypothetical protein
MPKSARLFLSLTHQPSLTRACDGGWGVAPAAGSPPMTLAPPPGSILEHWGHGVWNRVESPLTTQRAQEQPECKLDVTCIGVQRDLPFKWGDWPR